MKTDCICAQTLEAWTRGQSTPNYRIDEATAAAILRGCDLKQTSSVIPHHHYSDENIDDERHECRACGTSWKNRIFTHVMNASDKRSYFSPWSSGR